MILSGKRGQYHFLKLSVGFKLFLRLLIFCLIVVALVFAGVTWRAPHLLPRQVADAFGLYPTLQEVRARVEPRLRQELSARALEYGNAVYIRTFKEEAELELWVQGAEEWALFKTYPICAHSGDLGPKLAEGDRQTPEGFYRVGLPQLNPRSRFHLSFDLGFPNAYDQAHGRTGSYLMIHGACVSIGCYAMTDAGIEEIYLLLDASLQNNGLPVDVHAFPFRMTSERMAVARGHPDLAFWEELKPGYDIFEGLKEPAFVTVEGGRYVFSD